MRAATERGGGGGRAAGGSRAEGVGRGEAGRHCRSAPRRVAGDSFTNKLDVVVRLYSRVELNKNICSPEYFVLLST